MSILITGANGFMGKTLTLLLKERGYNVYPTNRRNLDVSDEKAVDAFFDKYKKIDTVIHCAIVGGKRTDTEDHNNFIKNIKMFNNLYKHRDRYRFMITFGSGAEFNRENNIDRFKEKKIFDDCPLDYYGGAKNQIAREIVNNNGNVFNFRLFGCFGILENKNRFIKSSILNCLKGSPITVHEDKEMDFFYIDDVCTVIEHYLKNYDKDNNTLPIDLNLCYEEKKSLKSIANYIKDLTSNNNHVIINNERGKSYSGNGLKLKSLNLPLVGLDEGIRRIYNTIINNR